jgi:hypothetical protein
MIDIVVHNWNSHKGVQNFSQNNLPQQHTAYHRSHLNRCGVMLRSPMPEAGDCLDHSTVQLQFSEPSFKAQN